MSDKFSVEDVIKEYSNKVNEKKAFDSKTVEFKSQKSAASMHQNTEYRKKDLNSKEKSFDDLDETLNKVLRDKNSESTDVESKSKDEHHSQKSKSDNENNSYRSSSRNIKNAEVIDKMMKSRKKRVSHGKKQPVTPVNRPSVKDIDMGLTGKIIPKTEEFDKAIDIPEDATFEEKTRLIYEKRKKKVDSFKLKTVDENILENQETNDETSGQMEFESYDQAPKILKDIQQVKSSLILRLCILLFTGIFSILITLGNDLDLSLVKSFDKTINPSAYVFVNTILGILSIVVSYTVLLSGIKKLFKRNADCDSLAALGIFFSIITGIVMLFDPEIIQDGFFHMYMSVSIAGLMFNTFGKLLIVKRAERNFNYAAGEYERFALINIDNEDVASKFTRGSLNDFPELATMRKTEFIEDFMKNSYSSDASDKFSKKMTPIVAISAVIIGLLSLVCDRHADGLTEHLFVMLASISGTISLCSSLIIMLVVNIPLSNASKKYLHYSAVMLGYSSVEEFADTNSVLVDAEQLFPDGMVDFVNLKLLSSTMIEECILMAASLACQANSILKPAFYKMLRGKTEMLYPVESYIYEDSMGLSGWIENKRVLLGTRELMENHSIEGIPTLAKEKEYSKGNTVLYLSISGVVSTLFVVRVNSSLSVSRWLKKLDDEGITTVIRTVDGFINLNMLSELFDVNPSSLKLLSFRYHKDYQNETEYLPRVSASMLCSGHFPSFSMLIIGAKKLKFVSQLGIAMQFGATVLGMILALIMTITGAFSQITPTLVLGYQGLFGLFTMLIQKIKKP